MVFRLKRFLVAMLLEMTFLGLEKSCCLGVVYGYQLQRDVLFSHGH